MRSIWLLETQDGRFGINDNGRVKIIPPFGSKPPEPDITKCNTVGGKSTMKFGEILKAEMDKKAAEKQKQEKVLSRLRFNRRFWEKIAELKIEGMSSSDICRYMYDEETIFRRKQEKNYNIHPRFCSYLTDETGIDIRNRSDIEMHLYLPYEEIFYRTLKNHGVLGDNFDIPDDLEIPEETLDLSGITPACTYQSHRDAHIDRIIESGNKAQELYEKISPSQDKPRSLLSKLKFWK